MESFPQFQASLGHYCADEQIALEFRSEDDLGKAFELLCDKLRRCPFAPVGSNTIILPKEATEYFKDLSPREIAVR